MSFFDDLKKPAAKAEPQQKQFVITNIERQQLVNQIWTSIRLGCESAKKSGKRDYRANYLCYLGEGIYTGYRGGTVNGQRYRKVAILHDADHPLIRRTSSNSVLNILAPDYDDVRAYDYVLWNAAERDKILQLLRQKLVVDGFPADAVRAHEYVYGGEGTGIIQRNKKTMPTIKVDVKW